MTSLARPIFVVGCPRSGTTLVQCILSASSQAFSLPETHFFSYVAPRPSLHVSSDDLRAMRSALELEADLPPLPEVWRSLEKRRELSALDVFVALIEYFRPASDTAHRLRAIEKTPRHVLHLDT